jgi:hypothetical protein
MSGCTHCVAEVGGQGNKGVFSLPESSTFACSLFTLLDVNIVLRSLQKVYCAASAGEKDDAHTEFRSPRTITYCTSFDLLLPGMLGDHSLLRAAFRYLPRGQS